MMPRILAFTVRPKEGSRIVSACLRRYDNRLPMLTRSSTE